MPAPARQTVLLGDDEKDILTSMGMALRGEKLNVLTAAKADEALELIATHAVDSVITDVKMPGMDGIQLLKRIREHDNSMQVIVMTGYTEIQDTLEQAAQFGAAGFLAKPLEDIGQFLQTVHEALDKRNAVLAQGATS